MTHEKSVGVPKFGDGGVLGPNEYTLQINTNFTGTTSAGGNDTVRFTHANHSYSVSGNDSMLDIATVWNQAEFNVVGDAGGSRADFNKGSSVTVGLAVTSGSSAAPTCKKNGGTTGETNNLNLGPCTASGGATPAIAFTESD